MIWQGSNDNELIELLQNNLPQDLTEDQIARLRQALGASPQVRDALLEELRLETGLSTRLAPAAMSPDDFIQKIEQMSSGRGRLRWLWLSIIVLSIGGLVAGGVGLAIKLNQQEKPQDTLVNNTPPVIVDPGTGEEDKGKAVVVDPGKGDKTPGSGDPPAPLPAGPLAEPPMQPWAATWRLFDDPSARGDRTWVSRLPLLMRAMAGAKFTALDREWSTPLKGRYELIPPNDKGRAIRLRLSELRKLRFDFAAGDEAIRIEQFEGTLRAFAMQRGQGAQAVLLPRESDPAKFLRKSSVERLDAALNFNWGAGSPGMGVTDDQFAVRWVGALKIERAGKYRFHASADDGVIVYIAGNPVIHQWAGGPVNASSAEIDLPAGRHEIIVEYFEDSGEAKLKIEWEGPGMARAVLGAPHLRQAPVGGAAHGLAGTYYFGPLDETALKFARILGDDGGRWRIFREGAIDLRYQDGHVVVARGDVPILAVPMSKPPTDATMDLEGRVWLIEDLRLKPLVADFSAAPAAPKVVLRPADMAWKFRDDSRELIVEQKKGEDGSLTIRRQAESSNAFQIETAPIDLGGAAEVTLDVSDVSDKTALAFQIPGENGQWAIYVVKHGKHHVLSYNFTDRNEIERRVNEGWIVPQRFQLKARYAAGHMAVFFSPDGKAWSLIDWRPYEWQRVVGASAYVAISGLHDKGERGAVVHGIYVNRFDAAVKLADPKLFQAAAAVKVNITGGPDRFADAHAQLAVAMPAGADPLAWRVAANAALLSIPARSNLREEAALDLIDQAIDAGAPVDAVVAALEELPKLLHLTYDDKHRRYFAAIAALYDDLAQRIWSSGDRDQIGGLLDAWYRQDFGGELRGIYGHLSAPLVTTRLHLYHLWERGQWEALQLAALRYEHLAASAYPYISNDAEDYTTRMLGAWMLAQANEHLTEGPASVEADSRFQYRRFPARWPSHPLIVDSDRESLNTVSELLASVESKAYDHACRILARQSLPDGIAPVDKESRLFKATYVLLRQLIESNEPVAAKLKEQYGPVATIRLRQAIDQGRIEVLDALATQFHGTEAAAQASAMLADRDLSVGNFFSAAARYESMLEQAAESSRPALAAKRRLALAMAGVAAGEPVKQPVELGGRKMSAAEFESIVSAMLEERRSTGMFDAANVIDHEAIAARPLKLSALTDLAPPRDLRDGAGHRMREVSFAFAGHVLLVHQHGRLSAYDLNSRQMIWRKEESTREMSSFLGEPATPLVIGRRVIVPFVRDRRFELTSFDLTNGNVVWRQEYDDALAGDPIVIGAWIYVLSVQRQAGDNAAIVLNRVAPESGESVMAKRVVRARYGEELYRVGRPVLHGDTLLFRTGSALVCCDLLGSPRWVRRLSLVPASADPPLFDFQSAGPLLVEAGQVVVTAPGSPHVVCVDADSGEEIWSYLQPRLRRLVGKRGDKVIIAGVNRLEALDFKTGKLLWQTHVSSDYDAILPAVGDELMTVTLDRIEKKDDAAVRVRRAQWLSAVDGKFTKSVPLDDAAQVQLIDAEGLATDGKYIVGLSNVVTKGKVAAKVIVLEAK